MKLVQYTNLLMLYRHFLHTITSPLHSCIQLSTIDAGTTAHTMKCDTMHVTLVAGVMNLPGQNGM